MAQFVYYEIEGVDSLSFVAHALSYHYKYSSKQVAIGHLEEAIEQWRSEPVFVNFGEIVFEAAAEKLLGYRHQIVFRHKADSLLVVYDMRVVKHVINYDL